MKYCLVFPVVLCGAALNSPSAWSQTTPTKTDHWEVGIRSLQTDFSNRSDGFSTSNFNFSKNAIGLSRKSAGEVDLTHFLGGGLAVEVGYALPTKRNVNAIGGGSGSVETTQLTAMLQYHRKSFVTGLSAYVGAGFGSITTSKQSFTLLNATPVKITSSTGAAVQVGLDYKLSESVVLNLDYKYLYATSDLALSSNGNKLTSLKLDPATIGFGIGVRF